MSEPVRIGSVLGQWARRRGFGDPRVVGRLFAHWHEVVGERVAGRCEPVSLKDGVLKVRAASPAWAAELKYLGPELIRRVSEELGPGLVSEVKVVVGGRR